MIKYTVETQGNGSSGLDNFREGCSITKLLALDDSKKEIHVSQFHNFKILGHNLFLAACTQGSESPPHSHILDMTLIQVIISGSTPCRLFLIPAVLALIAW